MKRTKIEWCDSTWNPVTGCRHGCEYCYARRIAERFAPSDLPDHGYYNEKYGLHCLEGQIITKDKAGKQRKCAYPYGFEPTFHGYRLNEPERWEKSRTIFVCSMADLFGDWVPDEWIEEVFDACGRGPQHRYLFLTKNPKRYLELENKGLLPHADNFWFGTSVTNPDEEFAWFHNPTFHWFVSVEPMLDRIGEFQNDIMPEWIIVGAETGNRKDKIVPKREWINEIFWQCLKHGIPLFMKDSLIPIIGEENMIREFPWEAEATLKARE